jgi:hypothetical protein
MDFLEQMFDWYAKYGFKGLISVIISFFALNLIIIYSKKTMLMFSKRFRERTLNKLKAKFEVNRKKLTNHLLFDKFEYLIHVRIPKMKINCPLRKKIFTEILTFKMKAFENHFKALIADPELLKYDNQKLCQEIITCMGEAELDWQRKSIENDIPEEVILKLYEEISQIKDFSEKYIRNICYYKTCNSSNWEKMDIIMNHLWNMEEYIIGELEKILDELNGTISNIKTEQFECSKCFPCKAFVQSHEKHHYQN